MVSLDNRNKEIFMNEVLNEFMDKVTGANIDTIIDHPEESILVGKLSPVIKNDENSSQVDINRVGLDFFINHYSIKEGKITILPKGGFYYRVYPTFIQQKDYMLREASNLYKQKFESIDELDNFLKAEESDFEIDVLQIYNKVSIDGMSLEIKLSDVYKSNKNYGFMEFTEESQDSTIINFLQSNLDKIRKCDKTYHIIRDKVKLKNIISEADWDTFIRKCSGECKFPKWNFGVDCEIRPISSNELKVSVSIFNLTNPDSHKKDKMRVNTLFNSGIELRLENCEKQPIELAYFEDDYKYDKKQAAIGHNCTVIEEENRLYTTHLPVFNQKRLKTRDDILVKFGNLIDSPIQELKYIANEMDKEYKKWKEYYNIKSDDLTLKGKKQLEDEIQGFDLEIKRFKNGIRIINEYSLIRDAFKYMNIAFSKSAKNYDTWRLFQIVFIVSLIPDVCTSEYSEEEMGPCYIDNVDLLYFPTGGGKTEAFIGITVFTLFFDRLRGKNTGVSAFIKYPLRLLSVQQVQRLADILAMAELIRRKHEDMIDGEVFSLGYFVGDKNTPNKITESVSKKFKNMTTMELSEEYRIVDICPFCQSKKVIVEFIPEELRLVHRCEQADCSSEGILPVFMVDREIFRYLPTVIISTIDKFASIGVQADFRNVLGEVRMKCLQHGYSSRLVCTEREKGIQCEDSNKWETVTLKDPAPTLFIQDELHLIRESLGVYDAHYESLLQYLIHDLSSSKKKIKIIGATATISAYKEQINHLYLKEAIRFPCESPYLNKNFYAYIDEEEVHRKIIGYAPFGKAILNSVVYSLKYLKQIVWKYYKDPTLIMGLKGIDIENEKEALKLLEDYWMFLQYNNVKLDGNKVIGALVNPINTELQKENIQPFDARKMTGDDTFQDVRKILAEVESSENVFNDFNIITATSMISHGVDAERFNLMLFFGMPGNNAEYIQAYSRVGRKYPGLVIMVMRPSRERDQSYLKNFIKFHEYKDILVEPVPINRWASKAIERTFPGVFSALILNYYDYHLQNKYGKSIYMMSHLQNMIKENEINKQEMIKLVKSVYQSNKNSIGKIYDEWIEKAVETFFEMIKHEDFNNKNNKDAYITEGMERLGFLKPMNSLRDDDTNVIIEMK